MSKITHGSYGDWRIVFDPKPIPDRRHDWDFWRDGYVDLDSPWQGTAKTFIDAVEQIAEIEREHSSE